MGVAALLQQIKHLDEQQFALTLLTYIVLI
jgi:hypothetical protein